MKKSPMLFVMLFLEIPAWAGLFSGSPGTTAAPFLKLGAGARAEAMGEAYSAVADDANALYWNPAGLTQIPGGDVTFMHALYLESSFYDYAAYGQNLGQWGALGIGGQFFSQGSITQTDITGTSLGSFTPNDYAISLGYAYPFYGASAGLTFKYISSTLIDHAQTEAVDLGLLSPGLWDDKIKFSLVATNLGGKLTFLDEAEDLPRALRLGSRLKLNSFLFSLEGVFPNDNSSYVALGTEYTIPLSQTVKAAFRAGYNSLVTSQLDGFNSFTFGSGIELYSLSLDYAFLPLGSLGNSHRFSISYHWGKGTETPKQLETSQKSMKDLYQHVFLDSSNSSAQEPAK